MNDVTVDPSTPPSTINSDSPRWRSARSVQLACHLNVQCMSVLHALAVSSSREQAPAFVRKNLDLFIRLSAEARFRAAQMPLCIVDVRFRDFEWFREVSSEPEKPAADPAASCQIPIEFCENLMLETLDCARQCAIENISAAKVMFGMSDSVAAILASLNVSQLRVITTHHAHCLRVRFDNNPVFWRPPVPTKPSFGLALCMKSVKRPKFETPPMQPDSRSNSYNYLKSLAFLNLGNMHPPESVQKGLNFRPGITLLYQGHKGIPRLAMSNPV